MYVGREPKLAGCPNWGVEGISIQRMTKLVIATRLIELYGPLRLALTLNYCVDVY